jgi:hypothetical protein
MAVLVKVNGLDAYALLDTSSTAVSVIHDFAQVAKLKMMQLDNPVALQLGTVGSHSISIMASARFSRLDQLMMSTLTWMSLTSTGMT